MDLRLIASSLASFFYQHVSTYVHPLFSTMQMEKQKEISIAQGLFWNERKDWVAKRIASLCRGGGVTKSPIIKTSTRRYHWSEMVDVGIVYTGLRFDHVCPKQI